MGLTLIVLKIIMIGSSYLMLEVRVKFQISFATDTSLIRLLDYAPCIILIEAANGRSYC